MSGSRHNLVVGLGSSGLSCVRHLVARGEQVVVCDTRTEPPGLARLRIEAPEVAVLLGDLGAVPFGSVDRVVVSPGVDRRRLPLVPGIPVVGDIELFARRAAAPVVAITGTNGKSTVTTMVSALATTAGRRVLVGGNLGTPALDLLEQATPEFYVLELSSYQLEVTSSLQAPVAALLNLSPHHLDRYADYHEYVATKARIFRGAGIAVVNRDDPQTVAQVGARRQVLPFGLGDPAGDGFGVVTHDGEAWLSAGRRPLLPAGGLRVGGRHNVANALAALAIGSALGLPEASSITALLGYGGLAHRLEWLAEVDGVRWINDSKATNAGATAAALRGLDRPLVLIAGGEDRGVDFAELTDAARGCLRAAVLVGDQVDGLARALAPATAVHRADDMAAAVALAHELARPGDGVLLSPACPSFDRYRDFEHRGEVFRAEVRRQVGGIATDRGVSA